MNEPGLTHVSLSCDLERVVPRDRGARRRGARRTPTSASACSCAIPTVSCSSCCPSRYAETRRAVRGVTGAHHDPGPGVERQPRSRIRRARSRAHRVPRLHDRRATRRPTRRTSRCARSGAPVESVRCRCAARCRAGAASGSPPRRGSRGCSRAVGAAGRGRSCACSAAVLREATELEGHADNAAAAVHGGLVAVGGRNVRPGAARGRARGRRVDPRTRDVDEGVARAARRHGLVRGCRVQRRSHRVDGRRARRRRRRRAARSRRKTGCTRTCGSRACPTRSTRCATALDAGAWCAFLSGSGPSVAALLRSRRAGRGGRGQALAATGRAMILGVDHEGARLQ